jgi:hypothetical protein
MGFSYVDNDVQAKGDRYRTVKTTKAAIAMPLWTFASTRDGEDRSSDQQTAQAMVMLWDKLMTNPMTMQAIGPDQALDLANRIGQLAGIDRDFKLRNAAGTPEEQAQKQQAEQQQLQQTLVQLGEQIMQQVDAKLAEDLKPLIEHLKKVTEETDHNSQAIGQLVDLAKHAMPMEDMQGA